MTADDSTDPFANAGGDICPVLPAPMMADLLGVDLMNPPAGLEVERVREFGFDHGLMRSAGLVKYGKRRPTWAEVDAWYADLGLPNEARAWQERRGKEEAADREREARQAALEEKLKAGNAPSGPDEVRAVFDGDPIPLDANAAALPSFPLDALPGAYGEMAAATAVAYQVDPAMSGPVVLAALAAACGGYVEAVPRPGWEEVTALHVVVSAPPSERKSGVINTLTKPLVDAERGLLDEVMPRRTEALTRKAIAEDAAKIARSEAAKANASAPHRKAGDTGPNPKAGATPSDPLQDAPADPVKKALEMAQRAEDIAVPPVPRLLADDVTPEALTSLMADHGGAMAVMSAEGGIFDTLAGRYAHKVPSLDAWLRGYSGDPIRVDRKGRPTEIIDRPVLTVCLMLQPVVLSSIGRNRDFAGRGLLARVLFTLPNPMRGHRDADPPPVPEGVARAYSAALSDLARSLRLRREDEETGPARVKFNADAAREVTALLAEVEPRLIDPADLGGVMEAWGGKHVGNVVRIAVLLHMAEHGAEGADLAVTAETFTAARRIGEFFTAHSIAALGGPAVAGDTTRENVVLSVLREFHAAAPYEPVSRRTMQKHKAVRRMKMTATDLEAVLDVLADHYVIRSYVVKVGGREQVNVYLHPDAAS